MMDKCKIWRFRYGVGTDGITKTTKLVDIMAKNENQALRGLSGMWGIFLVWHEIVDIISVEDYIRYLIDNPSPTFRIEFLDATEDK